jgi:type IV secretory pathway VirB10-like protein
VPATFDSIRFGGHVIALGDDPGIDPTGTSGLGATVDNHTRLSVENFLVLTAAGWLLNHGGSNCTVNCSSGSSTGAAVVTAGQNLFVHPAQSPTLHVSEGASVSIMLAHDVRLPRWAP